MRLIDRLRTVTRRELSFRLAEQARFIRERAAAARGARLLPTGPDPAEAPVPLFGALAEGEGARSLWMEMFPESAREAVSLADAICRNEIPLFSDLVDFRRGVDWHLDYRSGKRAPLRFYRGLHELDPRTIGDTKNIWELNRHNFFLHLAKAYLATGERRYYEQWREMLLSWISSNPHHVGINWESSIELAIRGMNWIWSSYFFRDELGKDESLRADLRRSLFLHARHIEDHLSFYFSPNTHLTVEALGLLLIGKTLPNETEAPRWVSRGLAVLEAELDRQILDDGGYFEMATYYHKYTIDVYLHYVLLKGGRAACSARAVARIAKLVKHLMLLSDPDGAIPLIGDSDGGELLHLGRDKRNMRGACSTAAILLDDPELAGLCRGPYPEESWWMLGREGLEAHRRNETQAVAPASCHSINPESGIFCFRTGMAPGDSFVTIDCGPHGWGACGHAHADLLSFEWFCGGLKVIVDPGTLTYRGSKALRDEVRSSQRHNTITIDGLSQSIPGDTFAWKKIAHPKLARAKTWGKSGLFEGRHDAYDAIGCGHARSVLFLERGPVVVADVVTVSRPHESLLSVLQFNEGTLERIEGHSYRFFCPGSGHEYFVRLMGTRDFVVSVRESHLYPDYNKAVPAPRLELVERDITDDQVIVAILGDSYPIVRSFGMPRHDTLVGTSGSGPLEVLLSGGGIARVLVSGREMPL
jgi:hypothetical protein